MKRCEYFLLQYAPAPAADLRLPIGLFLLEEPGRLVRFGATRQWRRVHCLDPRADLALLATVPAHMKRLAAEHAGLSGGSLRDELLRLSERGMGTVQIAPPRAVETDDPEAEFERLFQEHVELPRRSRPLAETRSGSRTGSRRWIRERVVEALEQRHLLGRMQRGVAVEEFTAPGDAFRMDFSYRPNGVVKYLHAISLERDWNQAKVLSYTFERIRQRQPAALTAITSDSEDTLPAAASCRQILLDGGIALQPLSDLDGFLEQVAAEF